MLLHAFHSIRLRPTQRQLEVSSVLRFTITIAFDSFLRCKIVRQMLYETSRKRLSYRARLSSGLIFLFCRLRKSISAKCVRALTWYATPRTVRWRRSSNKSSLFYPIGPPATLPGGPILKRMPRMLVSGK